MRSERSFEASPTSVAAARRYVAGALPSLGAGARDEILLMVSELATNAVRHARTGFRVTVELTADRLRVEVADRGNRGRPAPRNPSIHEPSGRGLRIVEVLADQWGVRRAGEHGAAVWFSKQLAGR